MCLGVSYSLRKNYGKIQIFLASLKSLKKGVGYGSISQRYGSGFAPKCHRSPALVISKYYHETATNSFADQHKTTDLSVHKKTAAILMKHFETFLRNVVINNELNQC
jgi:hypothetical protein